MLNEAIEAFNNIADRDIAEIQSDLKTLREYLADQSVRHCNKVNGLDYLNREADAVAVFKARNLRSEG